MVNNLLGISNTFWGDYNEYSDADIMILTTLTDEEIAETILFDLAFDFQSLYFCLIVLMVMKLYCSEYIGLRNAWRFSMHVLL